MTINEPFQGVSAILGARKRRELPDSANRRRPRAQTIAGSPACAQLPAGRCRLRDRLLLGPWPSSVARAERVFADLAVSALARRRHGVIPPKGARSSSSGFTAELLACSCSNLLHGEDNVRIAPDRQPRMDERTSSARYRGDPPRPCMLGCSVASQAARWRAIRLHWISH